VRLIGWINVFKAGDRLECYNYLLFAQSKHGEKKKLFFKKEEVSVFFFPRSPPIRFCFFAQSKHTVMGTYNIIELTFFLRRSGVAMLLLPAATTTTKKRSTRKNVLCSGILFVAFLLIAGVCSRVRLYIYINVIFCHLLLQ
jgi:hypothetical protein